MLEVSVYLLEFAHGTGDQCDVVGLYHKSSVGAAIEVEYLDEDGTH